MFVFSFQVRLLLTQVPRRLCVCLCQHLPAAVYSISARPVSGMGKPVMDTNLKAPSIRGQSRAAGQKGRGQERRNIFLFTAHLRRRFRCVKFFSGELGSTGFLEPSGVLIICRGGNTGKGLREQWHCPRFLPRSLSPATTAWTLLVIICFMRRGGGEAASGVKQVRR